MSSNLVYLPVEVSRRELISRAFLSCRLAVGGHDVLVFASDLFDRFGWPGPGIYIGKNVFRSYVPHDLRFYHAMKKAGIDVWYHDEEAGFFPGEGPEQWQEHLGRRSDVSVLGETDKVLAWGRYQHDYYKRKSVAAKVHIVGSVNFEVYRPEYAPLFGEYDREQTQCEEDYILFNTRFGAVNFYYTGKGHPINGPLFTSFVPDLERFDTLSQEGVLLYHFVGLIAEIALRHPEERIVVRPHPVENPVFYRQAFEMLSNVLVADKGDAGSWIRRSRCLVQNGCTTAIQANIARKTVITFVPHDSRLDRATPPLLNDIGAVVATREEVIQAILNPDVDQTTGRWPVAISSLHTIDAIEALVSERGNGSGVDEDQLRSIAWRSAVDFRARRLAYPFFPPKLAEVRMQERFFDRSFFNRFSELVSIANKRWTAPINVERVAPECWRVRPQPRA